MSWSSAWLIWLAVTAVSFGALEWVTLERGETLSANLRRWLGIDPPKPWRPITIPLFAGAVAAFAAWFVPHIVG